MPDRHAAAREYVERHRDIIDRHRVKLPNLPNHPGQLEQCWGCRAVAIADLLADADELVRLRDEVALWNALEQLDQNRQEKPGPSVDQLKLWDDNMLVTGW